eukprot:TRINITY_DN26202_c0_g1_i1.p1 TRINITY_DN26202_c0_g1~~TRINITY_DN26202_c0_g1_i1.p1  ORF type:complete len:305 (+),score=54.83 TRINITY_DN26202_c0_g1_i1:153-1067(+)
MRDLLEQVKEVSTESSEDVELGYTNGNAVSESGGDMGEFFFQVSQIKGKLREIEQTYTRVVQLHEQSKVVTRSEDMKKVREEMQGDTEHVKKMGHQVKGMLDKLDEMNTYALRKSGQLAGSSSERTRTSITAGLKKKLKEQMDKFQKLRSLIQSEYRDVVERRVYTVTGQRGSEEEIDKLMENGQSEQLFRQAILSGNRVADTVAEIEERHKAVRELEASLLELHQMFLDMSVLIEQQGAILDNVEKQVQRSSQYVQSGGNLLKRARALKIQTNKICIICAVALTVLVLLIILIVIWQTGLLGN